MNISPIRWACCVAVLLALAGATVVTGCGGRSAAAVGSASPPGDVSAISPGPTPTLPEYAEPTTIAFIKDEDLYTVWTNGAFLKRIAKGAWCAAWSPDGSRIAYGGGEGLFVMKADGSERRRAVEGPVTAGVSWSPDGRRIVFGSPGGYVARIGIVKADGSEGKDLSSQTGEPGYDLNPAWSPQGRIFFTRMDRNWIGEIRSVDPDGSDPEIVTAAESLASFSLSPDGNWLLLWKGGTGRCVRIAANGSGMPLPTLNEVVPLLNREEQRVGRLSSITSSWSPDGSRIVFTATDFPHSPASTAIYIIKVDGSHLKKVPNTAGGRAPIWRPW
jgi:Tol biopolymer transport system component